MKGGGLLPRILVACVWGSALLGSAGCGDLPLCQSEVFVAFDQTLIVTDADAVAPGVQTEIHLRTTLAAGDVVELEIDEEGGAVLDTRSTQVAADGSATFTGVSVPAPRVQLRATGRGLCGIGRAEIMVDVLAGADCAISLDPTPEPSAYYAPRGVLSTQTDPDPTTPGYQATVRVVTRPGWTAEIFETTVDEASQGVVTADAGGVAALPVTLLDGQVGLRAMCRGPAAELSSPVTTVVVDTTPPACAIVTPPPGTTLTPLLDEDPGTPAVDVSFAGHAGDGDVAGEPVTLAVGGDGQLPVAIAGTTTGADGTSTTQVALPALGAASGTYHVALTMRDHAGNLCTAAVPYDFVTAGCDIAVTSPRAVVTHDADDDPGNGAQVDITLAVAPACAGLPVTSVCGTDSPSGIVGPDGAVTLRAELCATSPCQASCVFTVNNGIPMHASATLLFDDQPRIATLSAVARNRQRVTLSWIAPASAPDVVGVVVRASPSPITDASFDAATRVFEAAAGTPGAPEQTEVAVRTGAARYFAIATVDSAGTRTAARVTGPVTPVFDQTGAIVSPGAPQGGLGVGAAIAHGKFNDDELEDLAIAVPGRDGAMPQAGAVYVYFGGPAGIGSTPDLILTGIAPTRPGERFGAGLTAIRWSSATRDDLVIGAPGADGGAGQIYVFHGGAGLAGGTRTANTADRTIRVDPSKAGWFATSQLGSVLVTADVDGDGTADLVASAPAGGSGAGGAIIVYGGTVTGDVALSTTDPTGANGAIVELFVEPATTKPGSALGFYLHAVGPMLGAPAPIDALVIAYADDHTTAGDSLYVLRGDGTRPAGPGVTTRMFTPGRDVRIDFATTSPVTEWGSQVISIEDQDDDGVRDLVIGAYRAQGDAGQVLILSGSVGTPGGVGGAGGVVQTSDPGVTLTTISPASGVTRFGAVIAAHDGASHADIDGDGHEDLLIGGVIGSTGAGLVWFGGAIGTGPVTSATASYVIPAPSTLTFSPEQPQGFGGQARWIGDINGDGLDDVCWASPFDNGGDGSFEVLWDDAR